MYVYGNTRQSVIWREVAALVGMNIATARRGNNGKGYLFPFYKIVP